MLPKVIMHNTITVNGAVDNFPCNLELHYRIAGEYKADLSLVGSTTAKLGIEMYMDKIPPETGKDFIRPVIETGDKRSFIAFTDSRGILKGLLHVYRNFEFCKDVIVIITDNTPQDYVDYLKERQYCYFKAGKDRVDIEKALEHLYEVYRTRIVISDSGAALNGVLLNRGLVDEISLIITPLLVCKSSLKLFEHLDLNQDNINLEMEKCEQLDKDNVHLLYKVKSVGE